MRTLRRTLIALMNLSSQDSCLQPSLNHREDHTLTRRALHWRHPFLDLVCDRRVPISTACAHPGYYVSIRDEIVAAEKQTKEEEPSMVTGLQSTRERDGVAVSEAMWLGFDFKANPTKQQQI